MAACCPDMVVRSQRFILLRGHEVPEVEDTIVEREGFLIVSKRGAGAEFVARFSAAGTSPNWLLFLTPVVDPERRPFDPERASMG
jgi:hypothetical protein